MIYVFLADGFEEIEALATVDVLRRAKLNVVMVGVGGRLVRGSHGIVVTADVEDSKATADGLEAVVLPGGMPGTQNLEQSETVQHFLDIAEQRGLKICAICAAPSILGHRGMLRGRKAVCYPGHEKDLTGADVLNEAVAADGPYITARGAGVATDFGLRIVSELVSPEQAAELKGKMQCR